MSLSVGELHTEVAAEPERGGPDAREAADWQELARLAALRARLRLDALRTRAEGYDD